MINAKKILYAVSAAAIAAVSVMICMILYNVNKTVKNGANLIDPSRKDSLVTKINITADNVNSTVDRLNREGAAPILLGPDLTSGVTQAINSVNSTADRLNREGAAPILLGPDLTSGVTQTINSVNSTVGRLNREGAAPIILGPNLTSGVTQTINSVNSTVDRLNREGASKMLLGDEGIHGNVGPVSLNLTSGYSETSSTPKAKTQKRFSEIFFSSESQSSEPRRYLADDVAEELGIPLEEDSPTLPADTDAHMPTKEEIDAQLRDIFRVRGLF